MNRIFKYRVDLSGETLELPEGAKILSVQNQEDHLTLWAIVNPDKPVERRCILCCTTGQKFPAAAGASEVEDLHHLGTVQFGEGSFVVHVFELLNFDTTSKTDDRSHVRWLVTSGSGWGTGDTLAAAAKACKGVGTKVATGCNVSQFKGTKEGIDALEINGFNISYHPDLVERIYHPAVTLRELLKSEL